jgi:hypothetical protein
VAERTYYDILHVSPAASDEEIKAAYRALAWQPSGPAEQDELKLINEAYATLSSPQRRAAYDQTLASGAAAALLPSAPVAVLPTVDDAEERVPKGPLHLRLWGMVTDLVWHVYLVKYVFIPFTWIIAGLLIFAAIYLVDGYRLAVHPNAFKTTLHDVLQDVPRQKYISVVARANYEDGFTVTGKDAGEYYVLMDPPYVILLKGPKGQSTGRFTGLLRPFDLSLSTQLQSELKDPYWEGAHFLTTHYLDVSYLPGSPTPYLVGLAAVLLALAAIGGAELKRYTVFSAGPHRWDEPVGGMLEQQVRVEAVGRFRAEGGRSLFHAGLMAVLAPDPAGGFSVSTWVRSGKMEQTYSAAIPAGSQVQLGIDYAGGRGRPTLKVRVPGQTLLLRLESLQVARLLAQAIRG